MPIHMPFLNAGLKLRTDFSSWPPGDARQRASKPTGEPTSARCSRGQHAGADGLVDALDLGKVQATAGVADDHGARHLQSRNRLPAAGGDGAGTGGQNLAAFQQRLHLRMVLELLERLEGCEARVFVVESHDKSHVHAVLVEVIDEAATVGAGVERPTQAVLDQPRLDTSFRELPQLLHAQTVGLRAGLRVESEALDQLLREAAARALGDDGRASRGSRRPECS